MEPTFFSLGGAALIGLMLALAIHAINKQFNSYNGDEEPFEPSYSPTRPEMFELPPNNRHRCHSKPVLAKTEQLVKELEALEDVVTVEVVEIVDQAPADAVPVEAAVIDSVDVIVEGLDTPGNLEAVEDIESQNVKLEDVSEVAVEPDQEPELTITLIEHRPAGLLLHQLFPSWYFEEMLNEPFANVSQGYVGDFGEKRPDTPQTHEAASDLVANYSRATEMTTPEPEPAFSFAGAAIADSQATDHSDFIAPTEY